jgi:hypothetical protein
VVIRHVQQARRGRIGQEHCVDGQSHRRAEGEQRQPHRRDFSAEWA